jgi:hypothetical protein
MNQIEETSVPAPQIISQKETLDLVRELSEHKRRRDPNPKFKSRRELPKISARIVRRFIHSENGNQSFHGLIFLHFVSEMQATAFRTKTSGRYLMEWQNGSTSFVSEQELKSNFSEVV